MKKSLISVFILSLILLLTCSCSSQSTNTNVSTDLDGMWEGTNSEDNWVIDFSGERARIFVLLDDEDYVETSSSIVYGITSGELTFDFGDRIVARYNQNGDELQLTDITLNGTKLDSVNLYRTTSGTFEDEVDFYKEYYLGSSSSSSSSGGGSSSSNSSSSSSGSSSSNNNSYSSNNSNSDLVGVWYYGSGYKWAFQFNSDGTAYVNNADSGSYYGADYTYTIEDGNHLVMTKTEGEGDHLYSVIEADYRVGGDTLYLTSFGPPNATTQRANIECKKMNMSFSDVENSYF